MKVITYHDVENKIVFLRNMQVILDSDVADLYQVETKRINEAVKNNTEEFPATYLIKVTKEEVDNLKSKISTSSQHGGQRKRPTAFTEKGLYMLATILKSSVATQTTLLIIDTFSKARELSRVISQSQEVPDNSVEQKTLMQKASDLITHLVVSHDNLQVIDTETVIEMNLAILKIKRTVKKSK